jgi:hypothetical protein
MGDIYVLIFYSVERHVPKNETDSKGRNKEERSKKKGTQRGR